MISRILIAISALALVGACGAGQPDADAADAVAAADAAKPVDIDVLEIMAHTMDPGAKDFWSAWGETYDEDGLHDMSAKTEEDWTRVENGATTVIVASNMMMMKEFRRQPESDWVRHAQKVAVLAQEGKNAAEQKNLAVMEELGAKLDDACGECHKQFEKPSGSAPG